MDQLEKSAPLNRRQLLLRSAVLIGAAAAAACRHTAGGVTQPADEYDSMHVTPPAPSGSMAGGEGGGM